MEELISSRYVVSAVLFSMLGLLILAFSFIVLDKMTPGHLWKEVIVEKNLPLAIVVGSMTLAVAQIIASAIHG